MNILTTTDYSIFSVLENNRGIDKKHVDELVISMSEKLTPFIIPVTNDYKIIDGQHRFEALKKMGLPINYYINSNYDELDMIRLNRTQKNWTNYDYLNYWLKKYENTQNNNYQIYLEFINEYKCLHTIALTVLCLNNDRKYHNQFKDGTMNIKDITLSHNVMQELQIINKYFDKAIIKKSFILAYLQCKKKNDFKFSQFISQISNYPQALTNQVGTKKFVENIEYIYNYRRKNKINLRFGVTNE